MKITQTRAITKEKHLNLYAREYRDRNQTRKSWVFASRKSAPADRVTPDQTPDAVVVVPYHIHEKKLVLIREFRVALGVYQYGFPAGLIDPGENCRTAGERELREETGLSAIRVLKETPPLYSSSGLTDESVSLVFVECEGCPDTRYNEASEDIEVLLVSQKEGRALLENETSVFDVKTWIVLDGFVRTGSL